MFQNGFEPTTYRFVGKHATNTATEASLAMTYSIPILTCCSYLAAAGTLVVGIECRLPARYTLSYYYYAVSAGPPVGLLFASAGLTL